MRVARERRRELGFGTYVVLEASEEGEKREPAGDWEWRKEEAVQRAPAI